MSYPFWDKCGHATASEGCYTCLETERNFALLQVSELQKILAIAQDHLHSLLCIKYTGGKECHVTCQEAKDALGKCAEKRKALPSAATVYLLWWDNGQEYSDHDSGVMGVFSSKDGAEKYLAKSILAGNGYRGAKHSIIEEELDPCVKCGGTKKVRLVAAPGVFEEVPCECALVENPKDDHGCRECWSNDGGRAWIHIGIPLRQCTCPCHTES